MRLLILLAAALLLSGCRKTIHEAHAPAPRPPYTSGATFSI
jgi:hypothetical protein